MYSKVIIFCVFFTHIDDLHFASANNEIHPNDINLQHHKFNDTDLVSTNLSSKTHHLIDQSRSIVLEEVSSNNTLSVPIAQVKVTRKRLRKRKRRRRRKHKNQLVQAETIEASLNLQNATSLNTTTVGPRRKKKRKRRKKHKQTQNDILEITTARSINNITKFRPEMNETLKDLVKKLNKNSARSNQIFPEKFNDHNVNNTKVVNSTKTSTIPKKRNRCKVNNGGCSQICRSRGRRRCSCLEGYALARNRKKCVDVDECRTRNGDCEQICLNTLGTHFCDCSSGYRLSDDSKSCQDINECHLRNGHGPCEDTCLNTRGSYSCDCSGLNGTRLSADQHTCEDINQCEESNPGCSHICVNTRMSGFCTCPEGMELMSDYKTCQDVDECEDVSFNTLCSRGCINTIGSYYCEEDLQNDHYMNRIKVPVCPPLDLPERGFITCARNRSLPYDTFTKNGRKIIRNSPGTKCRLECPIGFRLLGEGIHVCDISGKWIIKKQGSCIRSPYPKLQCPPDQIVSLKKDHQRAVVYFPAPETNIRWKIVKSYPEWGKNLQGELPEGHHNIQFSVTDPASKLSSSCSFFVLVIKE